MESKIDELLKQLDKYLFADNQQIIIELRHYLNDFSHTEGDLAFISSKIFNSSESLLEFLRKNIRVKDKLITGIKKRIFELIIEFSYQRPNQLSTYLAEIKDTCMTSFIGDEDSLVRESALQLLLRIIDHYSIEEVNNIIQPKEVITRLLDEIKFKKPSASVKGTIWNMVGALHNKFQQELREFLVESQDQMFQELRDQFKSKKPEFKAIVGILKGLSQSLEDQCTLEDDEIDQLFIIIKTGMQPIVEVRHKQVQKYSMKLFTTHVELFKKIIPRHSEDMVKLVLQLCVDYNMEVRDAANDMLGRLMQLISDGLTVDQTIHKETFEKIVIQFQVILDEPDNNVQLISAIKAIGVFSKAIKIFLQEKILVEYLDKLIDLSEQKLVKEFENQKNPEDDVQNFKYILKKQKHLISYIESYSFILLELDSAPSEQALNHFFKVCSIGVNNHRKLYEKYKHRFYESLASLVMALSAHQTNFAQWIRKFVRSTLQETLKIPDAAIFGGESPEESLKDAIQFWREWLNKDKLWSEFTCRAVYDELVYTIIEDIKEVILTYRVVRSSNENQVQDESDIIGHSSGMISYIADNNNNQQYLRRLADFLELLIPSTHEEWILKWIPQLTDVLVKKSIETPRIPKLYQILRTAMQVCNKYKYFNSNQIEDSGEKKITLNKLLSFFKELIGKSEEYQDELLLSCIDLLLHVPLDLLYNKDIGTDNVELWKGMMMKALELGQIESSLAMTCLNMLEQWFNTLPPSTITKLYEEILPKLSDYLNVENIKDSDSYVPDYYHQKVLEQETEIGKQKITRQEISVKVLDLLGKIGGYAHNIINNELSKKHDKKNFIRWDPEKRLKFTLPLYNKKLDIYLDSCLPRIVDLAQNSNRRDMRIAAQEFLHSLIIYMIGKNAQKPKQVRNPDQSKREETAAFAKLYAKLFPVIIKLACEIETISRQLFEPLCYQIVRWFSSSKIHEHPEVESLLDSLIEGAQNKNNTALRQLCSNAVAEFAKWSLKQMNDAEIEQNPANIKSLIRRIDSNSNHPDPYKRLSSVLCFSKIFSIIRESDPLVDRFCLEICYSVLQSLKMCYDQMEQSHEVIQTCSQLLPKIEKVILKKWSMLIQPNNNRGVVPDLQTLMLFVFEKFKSFETIYRRESIKLWEHLVKQGPPIQSSTKEKIPNDLKSWIQKYYSKKRKDKSILMKIQEIEFNIKEEQSEETNEILRKNKLTLKKKNFDTLSSQLEFMEWLLTEGKFNLDELHELKFQSTMISQNINKFLNQVVLKTFEKNRDKICSKVLVCKEDRELVTKSQIIVMSNIYRLLNLSLEKIQLQGSDQSLQTWLSQCQSGLESGLFGQVLGSNYEDLLQNFFIEMAMLIVLIPQVFKLQLLVEDKELESALRREALKYLRNVQGFHEKEDFISQMIEEKIIPCIPILDITSIDSEKGHIYSPRLLMILCLGLLKLAEIDASLKESMRKKIFKKKGLKGIIENWLSSNSPFFNESARVLVKFIVKLRIPNKVVLEWIVSRNSNAVFHKCSEMIIDYIVEKWADPYDPEDDEYEDDEQEQSALVQPPNEADQKMKDEQIYSGTQSSIAFGIVEENENDKTYSCLGEFLISKVPSYQSVLYSLFITIVERLQENDDHKRILIRYLPLYCQREIKHEFKDVAINQIKIFGLISLKSKKLLMDENNKDSQTFIQYLFQRISAFLKEKFSVYVKKEVFNLISLIAELPVMNQQISGTSKKVQMLECLKHSLNYVKKSHFPLKTRLLKPHSNEAQNFHVLVEAYLNMAIITKNLSVLKSLYQLIREHKTSFEETLKKSLNIIVTQQINTLSWQEFNTTVTDFINEFLRRNFDLSIDDNIRWAIAKKIIVRILETCSKEYLIKLMADKNEKFKDILEESFVNFYEEPIEFFQLVREKTFIMNFYEILYRRLPLQDIKDLNVKLYGAENPSQLTKYLITYAASAKRQKIAQFEQICQKVTQDSELKEKNSVQNVQMSFCCSAYSLLSSVIVCTQTNESAFSNYLFQNKQNKAPISFWSLIINTQKDYEFQVQTNFNHIELKSIEQKLAESTKNNQDIAGIRVQQMMNDYLQSSFMTANGKFNQGMVFETQLDQISMKREEEKYQEIFNKKYNPQGKYGGLGTIPSQGEEGASSQIGVQDQSSEEQQSSSIIPDENSQFELDIVNQHKCMKNIKRCIERMKTLFGEEWKENQRQMPKFGHFLLEEFCSQETHINIKVFILKIVTNNPQLFKPHASLWFEPICEYIVSKQKGSKGFHYFLRDICTMLISWDYLPPDSSSSKVLLTKVINCLIKISADKRKLIFKQNIQIVSTLMERWKKMIAVNKVLLRQMILIPDSEPESHLWKMNAIEVLALAVCYDIPVLQNPESDVEFLSQGDHRYKIQVQRKGAQVAMDPLIVSILKIFESKKKQIIYAASELLGMILQSQSQSQDFQDLLNFSKTAIFANEINEKHDIFVYSVERISREFKNFLTDSQLFHKTISFINILTGSMRAAVFKTFERYIDVAKKNNNLQDINEIAMSITFVYKKILADINDDNQQTFISLLITLSQLKGVDSVEKLLASVVPNLKNLFIKNKNEYSRGRFYDLMVNLYDRYDEYKTNSQVKGSLIHGLSDKSKMIRDKLADFWNDKNRLLLDPMERLQQLMDIMYVNDEESIWLTNSAYLILQVSAESSDFQRKIFEEALQECQFAPLHLNLTSNLGINRSQPMTPLYTQIDQMIQASQEQQSLQSSQNQIDSTTAPTRENQRQKIPQQRNQMHEQQQLQMEQGFVRATQIPQFTQTLAMQSSLIAGIRSAVQPTLSDHFYSDQNKGPQNNKLVHQAGIKGGTHLFTIKEEAGEDQNDKQQSQDSEGFIAPSPVKRKKNLGFSKFFKQTNFIYRPMEVKEGQKIRFIHEGVMPSHLARQEEIRRMQRQQFIDRTVKMRKNQVSLYRKYRIGELPDIQIDYQDMLKPLMAIVRQDSTIATEIFVEIFSELYKSIKKKETREKLGEGLRNILSSSKVFDYSVINCAHRIAIELLKIDGFTIDSDVIERTGEHSMSFQTALILLEESIIKGNMQPVENKKQKRRQEVSVPLIGSEINSIANNNRDFWFKLIKLYQIIGNEDALHGIWCQLAQHEGVIFKVPNNDENEVQNNSPNQINQGQEQQERLVNLIKYARDLKNKGKIQKALEVINSTLNFANASQDLEDVIQQELNNIKLEHKSELLQWDEISTELNMQNKSHQLHEIANNKGFKQVDLMIRSSIRCKSQWKELTDKIQSWMQDDVSKTMLEKNFSYELSLLFLTHRDFDRARIYIEHETNELLSQWRNLTKLSQVAQHFLVQRIQKIFEMKEFLNLVRKNDQDKIIKSMTDWKHRSPSQSFDKLSVWDDIVEARQFFIVLYAMQFKGTSLQKALQGQPTTEDLQAISDIQVLLNIQTAKGAYKMGAYDSSNEYLSRAWSYRNTSKRHDMRIDLPILKLKSEQTKSELRNMNFNKKMAKIGKIYTILLNKIDQNKYDLTSIEEHPSQIEQSPSLETIKTIIKSNLLKFNLLKKMLSIVLSQSQQEEYIEEYQKNTNYYLQQSFISLKSLQNYLGQSSLSQQSSNELQNYKNEQQGKILFKLSKFADKLLRKMEVSTGPKNVLKNGLTVIKQSEQSLAKMTIQTALQSLNLGYIKASDIIPRMLDVLSKYREDVQDEFLNHSRNTPSWLFLRWISQIAAILNRPESSIIQNMVAQIAQKYPQALYYPFKVINSNIEINELQNNQVQEVSTLFQNLKYKFSQYEMLNQWSEALDCMIFPEHRFRYWFQLVCDIYQDPSMQQSLLQASGKGGNSLKSNQSGAVIVVQKIRKIVQLLYQDIISESKPMVGSDIGVYNKQFIKKWQPIFDKSFGQNCQKLQNMDLNQIINELQGINKKLWAQQLFQGTEMVNKYSEWLDQLDCNEFYQSKNFIEVPGQYENTVFNVEPISSKNVKIASVKKLCLVLGSIRRPKKITVHGSNEKDYHLLIKGGEDLRLDQRVQQLFSIMNRIFKEDPACENRDLNLKTFGVVPITNRLGSFEWVDNTEPMKVLISNEHKRLLDGEELHESRAYQTRMNWLKKLPGNKNVAAPAQMHLALLKLEAEDVIKAFEEHQAAFYPFYLRNALENLCLTSSAFLTIKNQFIKSMATFSIASYLIGIGDRHLDNFLIDITDGEVLGIDFGIAFGSNVNLSIPELIPFRLTQQIEGVIAPHPLEGIYKQTMVTALQAMRKKKSLILDTCEIFVKEPLLDWVKDAKQRNKHNNSSAQQQQSQSLDINESSRLEESQFSWYPRQKIQIVKKKLLGQNPVRILERELKESVHDKKDYNKKLVKAIRGQQKGCIREHHLDKKDAVRYLEVEDQVDILIELARDPNILGRTWIGWSPHI